MTGSAYGNPRPYPRADMESEALAARLKVARGIATRARASGDLRRAASWDRICDELLDHLPAASDRAATSDMDGTS